MTSIKEKLQQIKDKYPERIETAVLAFIIIFSSTLGFGLGKMSLTESGVKEVSIEEVSIFQNTDTANNAQSANMTGTTVETNQGMLVGSKNSDKYHYPWCSGAKRISDANKVWFSSVEEARATGYKPAGNCPGLE